MYKYISLLSIFFCLSSSAVDYFVAESGSDDNPGTKEQPFATIQFAVNKMEPGDICYIRNGVYREVVNLSGKAGLKGKALTIAAYNNEEVVLDGTVKIGSDWTLDKGKVYKTSIKEDITQLFVDGKLMTLARFPNALAFSDKVWHRTASRCQKSRESTNGHVIDNGGEGKSIAKTGASLKGCIALLNFGAHATGSRVVQKHSAGSAEFDYSPKLFKYKTTLNFFFEGGVGNSERAMLDTAQEWAYDESKKELYLWADNGENPGGRQIYGKKHTYLLIGDASTSHISIKGINFFAGAFSFKSSDNISFENCNFNYYAASKRALGILGPSRTAEFIGSANDFCKNIKIYNCEFKYSDGSALVGDYVERVLIDNNLFNFIDYACVNNDTGKKEGFQASISLRMSHTKNIVYRRNTLAVSGNAQGFAASRYVERAGKRFNPTRHTPETVNNIISEFNFHTACGLLHTDGSSLYMAHEAAVESVARYNWFIGNGQRDFRWDGNNKPLQGVHANFYRNVSLGTSIKKMSPSGGNGFRLKGSYHEVYNNTGLGRGGELNVASEKGGNAQTITKNNAATHFTDQPIPGTHSNNFAGSKKKKSLFAMLRDPGNWDFRPKKDAMELIDKGTPVKCTIKGSDVDVTSGFNGSAPDLGAYEYGDKIYWIPGRREKRASMPIPKDGGINVKLDADLMYLNALGEKSSTVYLGLTKDSLKPVQEIKAPHNIVNLSTKINLEYNKTYFWRVDSLLSDGKVSKGKVWTFTTAQITPLKTTSGSQGKVKKRTLKKN